MKVKVFVFLIFEYWIWICTSGMPFRYNSWVWPNLELKGFLEATPVFTTQLCVICFVLTFLILFYGKQECAAGFRVQQ